MNLIRRKVNYEFIREITANEDQIRKNTVAIGLMEDGHSCQSMDAQRPLLRDSTSVNTVRLKASNADLQVANAILRGNGAV